MRGCSQEFESLTVKDKRSYVPAHYEYTQRNAGNKRTQEIYRTEVFGRKEKCISPIILHEVAVDGTGQYKPE